MRIPYYRQKNNGKRGIYEKLELYFRKYPEMRGKSFLE